MTERERDLLAIFLLGQRGEPMQPIAHAAACTIDQGIGKMIIEAFQRPDGMWSFRGIAMLGVQQDARAYPTCEAAVQAAKAQYPNETVSIVDPDAQAPTVVPRPSHPEST